MGTGTTFTGPMVKGPQQRCCCDPRMPTAKALRPGCAVKCLDMWYFLSTPGSPFQVEAAVHNRLANLDNPLKSHGSNVPICMVHGMEIPYGMGTHF